MKRGVLAAVLGLLGLAGMTRSDEETWMTSAPINRKVVWCCRTTGSPLLFTASNRTFPHTYRLGRPQLTADSSSFSSRLCAPLTEVGGRPAKS